MNNSNDMTVVRVLSDVAAHFANVQPHQPTLGCVSQPGQLAHLGNFINKRSIKAL